MSLPCNDTAAAAATSAVKAQLCTCPTDDQSKTPQAHVQRPRGLLYEHERTYTVLCSASAHTTAVGCSLAATNTRTVLAVLSPH